MNPLPADDLRRRLLPFLPVVALALVAVVALGPLLAEKGPLFLSAPPERNVWVESHEKAPVNIYAPPQSNEPTAFGQLFVVAVLLSAIGLRAWVDTEREPWSVVLAGGFVLLAAAMTTCHWFLIDRVYHGWQQWMYWRILNHQCEAPHQYRALPYGFARTLELLSGDWDFACLAYRCFFNYWFVWGWYSFARLFVPRGRALATLLVLLVYYPLSIEWYWGQLTNPLSHALFVLAMIYVVEDRWLLLAAALALGIFAKETVVLMVPVYWACHWRQGWASLGRACVLGLVCIAAFLAARLPLGWWPGGSDSMNGVQGLMISTNLGLYHIGIGKQVAHTYVPLDQNYLHPLLFVVPFLPFVLCRWRRIDGRLKALFLVLTPLLLFSNLCFGWLYESRNYVPLLPILTTMAMPGRRRSR